jgi:hypothetical protein
VRGRRARLSSGEKHARPRIPCSRLLGRGHGTYFHASLDVRPVNTPTMLPGIPGSLGSPN